ncbi:MAG TPA: formate--tetrahydrofolate ligase [Candidatus Hydrogenedentes bacterium]|nr:formate--tetrahydrofolate ligase [Candidatus Hydrogenedentota bacterium]
MLSDLEIAQATPLKRIGDFAAAWGIQDDELEPYGHYKAKVHLGAIERLSHKPNGKYIDVTAITPTPLGEGKTVTTIGLSLALNKLGKRSFACLRQPSMGPTFGIKGGAAGGGRAQVVPMEEFNLHLTGDIHAVEIAHNLLAAMIDNHLHQGNALGINPYAVTWRRVVDVSDRALRNIVIGLGGKSNGVPRESGFDITVASELMALLALTDGLRDLRKRIGSVVIGQDNSGAPLTADDLQAAGAMTVLLREALMPTLMQTTENTPVLVHTGPFANIAHGNSSIIADRLALKLSDYVVTESGFGVDMGAEKFVNIKCRYSGLKPDAMVVVATIRALKMHSGDFTIRPGKPFDPGLREENLDAIRRGAGNLAKQIENVAVFGVPCVVAINRFPTDTAAEIQLVGDAALEAGARSVAVSDVHAHGGEGGLELAEKVVEAAESGDADLRYLYPAGAGIKEKLDAVATTMYGADGVDYEPAAEKDIAWITDNGFGHLPLCVAKTQLSLSHNPALKGRPTGFRVPVRQVRLAAGAGFIIPYCGDIIMMPGLPSIPGATRVDIDDRGKIAGLF